jgi:hypothetical protein
MKNHKTILIICLILLTALANASILANTSIDKKSLSTDEVGMLSIKLFNDSEKPENGIMVKVTADEQIIFINDGESSIFATSLKTLGPGEGTEIRVKIKAISTSKPKANIYAYYGTSSNLDQASVTMVETKELAQTEKITLEKKNENGKDILLVKFSLTNSSNKPITQAGAELITPKGFEVITAPVMMDTVSAGGKIERDFLAIAPIQVAGEQKIILAYGFFDSNTPHYFEKEFKLNFQKPNYELIILVGILVLVIAGYLYIKKDEKKAVKGTAEKK